MPAIGTVRELLADSAQKTFIGREQELEILSEALEAQMPPVTFVHGIGGIGKSRLLEAFSTLARAHKAFVVRLDCRQFEPTPLGFLRELGMAIGGDLASVREASKRLTQIPHRVILILDNYEVLRLLDTWLRQDFVPSLPTTVHMILSGREAPLTLWLSTPGWDGLFRSVALEPLHESEAIEVLASSGMSESRARHVNRFTRGHPLALTLAGILVGPKPADLEDLALHRVIEELARMYLAEISDEITRHAIEAASVVRCVTVSLFRAMLPEAAPQDLYERLRALPFVHGQRDGLHIHDSVQQAIAMGLKASDPSRYRSYRRAAWNQLRTEVRTAPPAELWRYTADMLYLLENSIIREAFFPTGAHTYALEPARQEDAQAIFEIVRKWEGPGATRALESWWTHLPQAFSVARDSERKLAGFYCMFQPESLSPELLAADPVLQKWLEHLQTSAVPSGQTVLFCRRWLCTDAGEGPCGAQAACWLDIKRAYMRLRPHLRRIYFAATPSAFNTFGVALGQLGFQVIPAADVNQDGHEYKTAILDFGPASVDGWLAGLVAAELGVNSQELLDFESRELVLDGRREPLTRLEFSLLRYLHAREGCAVDRELLLRDVWGNKYDVGSNVVDVVVRSLRKKFGNQAGLIETVPGCGYRFRRTARPDSPS